MVTVSKLFLMVVGVLALTNPQARSAVNEDAQRWATTVVAHVSRGNAPAAPQPAGAVVAMNPQAVPTLVSHASVDVARQVAPKLLAAP